MHFRFSNVLGLLIGLLILSSCTSETGNHKMSIKGAVFGTTYSIIYKDKLSRDFQPQLDSLFSEINQEVSTYLEDSRIVQFNKSDSSIFIPKTAPQHFVRNFKLAGLAYGHSGGWFNPTIMPLVRYWKFGPDKEPLQNIDSSIVDSLQELVNFDAVHIVETPQGAYINKQHSAIELDFSAIAKGDAVDQAALLLDQQGIEHYMIEIGGELRCKGEESLGRDWIIGINTPLPLAPTNEMQAAIELSNLSLASSGNYRNFYEVNGVKYAHTINPFTGYPEKNRLLSASIFAKDCGLADALATASMAMGLEKAWIMIQQVKEAEAYFIYSDETGEMQVKSTPAVEEWLLPLQNNNQ